MAESARGERWEREAWECYITMNSHPRKKPVPLHKFNLFERAMKRNRLRNQTRSEKREQLKGLALRYAKGN